MKVFFNRPIKKEAWGGGSHFITSLCEYLTDAGVDVVFNLEEDINVLVMFDPRASPDGPGLGEIYDYKKANSSAKIVQRINDTDLARHAYGLSPHDKPWRTEVFLYANQFVDHTIFISNWVKNHYAKLGYEKRDRSDSVVINGCNSSFFYPAENKERSSGDKLKIVTHHWSDNPMKGADIYRAVDQLCNEDPDISFTYVGRYPKGYSPKNTKVIPPTYGKKIGDILREHDIYITGARFEACGMHHLEGAACGLPVIYHKDGGAINEICSDHGIEISSWEELVEAINFFKNKENLVEYFKKIDYNKIKGQNCYKKYHEIFKDLSGEKGEKE
jgi:glycosyltransferase involved in cell wall biosynthesis